ncbi:iron ABC transporter permease [Jonesia quinghaiensis]|uniref:iron ABC transporter permease n=1 Tax=Jonesia quinghaiensis TaxID=262806 RepID=UPI0003FC9DDB|nr:iron ABC transporter permease [Jonesia quinghaiensis]
MATTSTTTTPPAHQQGTPTPAATRSLPGLLLAGGLLGAWLLAACIVHLTQGTSQVGLAELWAMVTGADVGQSATVITQSRLPRLGAAVLVGIALGAAGASMQSVTRNPLASPDTTAVNAGAFLALTIVSAFGISLGVLPGTAVAFVGGLAAATLVLGISSGGATFAIRLVLAGSVIALGFSAITSVLLLLFPWETQGLFAWGAGSLSQRSPDAITSVAPIVAVALIVLFTQTRALDILQMGDDAARSLGVPLTRTRIITVICSVLLAAAAVTVAGPIGFVGLCAPLVVRLLAAKIRPLRRQAAFITASCIAGIALVLTADVAVRAVFGAISGVTVPTGVITSIIGALALILLAQRLTHVGDGGALASLRAGSRLSRSHPWIILVSALALLIAALSASVVLGDQRILLGDVSNWLQGIASIRVEIILDTRVPRITAAALAGAALALSGGLLQTFTRNPLADPGILGVTSAAGLGAVITLISVPAPTFTMLFAGALIGASIAGVVVFGLSSRGGISTMRLVLVGVGMSAGTSAITTLLLVQTDPWNQNKAITWLGGSTFGATFNQQVWLCAVLVGAGVLLTRTSRDLDIIQLDEVSPQLLGVALNRSKVIHLGLAIVLAATATATVGVISFVGLVAPHAARLLIGKQHRWQLPMTAVCGAVLVVVADAVGRSVLAPAQVPAGMVTALIGTPYFIWLLWKIRENRS